MSLTDHRLGFTRYQPLSGMRLPEINAPSLPKMLLPNNQAVRPLFIPFFENTILTSVCVVPSLIDGRMNPGPHGRSNQH